ncbi:histidine phosphatase family protein [Hydrogenophaga sp. 5NK40-0174]|uniref:histidine phosphatase family protein n=1 Tax=Hydrogenophaga sp. 5NK40-0174 TaxID=3127649 RepID=UPI0031085ED5
MRLVLVRHGASQANLAGLVTGTPNDMLSPAGIEQARQASMQFAPLLQPQACYTSQWRRAQQTAEMVFPSLSFRVDPRLGETDAGDVADSKLTDFLQDQPDFYTSHLNAYPGGESHQQLYERVTSWLDDARQQHNGLVLAVCHAGPIACLMHHALGISMERFPCLMAQHTSLSIIDYAEGDNEAPRLQVFSQLPDVRLSKLMEPTA